MKTNPSPERMGFDRIASMYRVLETLAFGSVLQRARTAHLGQITDAEEIALAGEGNGRFLQALLAVNPRCRVTCFDSSPGMLRVAEARIEKPDRDRVHFELVDLESESLPAERYDALVTNFFLDCFVPETLVHLLSKLGRSLCPKGKWFLSDFVEPRNNNFLGLLQGCTLRLLYCFFRRTCGIKAKKVSNPQEILFSLGMRETRRQHYCKGWITSLVYEKTANQTSLQQAIPTLDEDTQKALTLFA